MNKKCILNSNAYTNKGANTENFKTFPLFEFFFHGR